MELIFATHNENKAAEVRAMMPDFIRILTLNDVGILEEIEETGTTLEENAEIKSALVYKLIGKNVFSDDTGLFVEALNGKPGVYSSRYAGTGNSEDNIVKLMKELDGKESRKAEFRTVICLIWNGKTNFITGIAKGEIIKEKRGTEGFGYDPVFVPAGYEETFAEMDPDLKNHISHRHDAIRKLVEFLERGER